MWCNMRAKGEVKQGNDLEQCPAKVVGKFYRLRERLPCTKNDAREPHKLLCQRLNNRIMELRPNFANEL